jgi:pilus assembly protein Flp/PilA
MKTVRARPTVERMNSRRACIKNSFPEKTMNVLRTHLNRFVREEDGATMVEYGLMVALIAVVCIAAVTLLGTSLSSLFGRVSNNVGNAGT